MSNRYEEFLKRKITTKQQLLEAIQALPDDVSFQGSAGDIGGYDVSVCGYISIDTYKDEGTGNTIASFGHMECESYDAYNKGELTREQYEEFAS